MERMGWTINDFYIIWSEEKSKSVSCVFVVPKFLKGVFFETFKFFYFFDTCVSVFLFYIFLFLFSLKRINPNNNTKEWSFYDDYQISLNNCK